MMRDWLIEAALGALAAYGLSRIVLILLQRFLILKKLMPSSFRAPAHFSGSLFLVLFLLFLRSFLPITDFAWAQRGSVEVWRNITFILAVNWLLTRTLSLVKMVMYRKLDITVANNLRTRKIRTQIQFLERVVLIFIYVVALALVLLHFEPVRKIGGSLIASAGLVGVVAGFAAQRSLAGLAAGLQIAFTQPIRIDDVVIVEGEWGRVEEITLTYVVVRIWDKRAMVVPISYFVDKPFQNWTRNSSELLGSVYLNVDFATPIDRLRAEFDAILESTPLWDRHVAAVQVTDTTERAIQVRFLAGARTSAETFDLRCVIRERMIAFIRDHIPECMPQTRFVPGAPDSFEAPGLRLGSAFVRAVPNGSQRQSPEAMHDRDEREQRIERT